MSTQELLDPPCRAERVHSAAPAIRGGQAGADAAAVSPLTGADAARARRARVEQLLGKLNIEDARNSGGQ